MGEPRTTRQAAAEFGVTEQSVRAWIRAGAPTVRLGDIGRGRGSLVDVDQLRTWRAKELGVAIARPATVDMGAVSRGLWEVYDRPAEGETGEAWRILGIPRHKAAALLVQAFREIHRKQFGQYPEQLPPETESLLSIAVDFFAHRTHAPSENP